jgi:hypothetical protein
MAFDVPSKCAAYWASSDTTNSRAYFRKRPFSHQNLAVKLGCALNNFSAKAQLP